MPILANEPHIYPDDLLDSPEFDAPTSYCDHQWWAFNTRARQEKSLARDLLQRDIAFYLPLIRRRLLIRGRSVCSHIPLFTGYVFVKGSNEDRVRALMTNRVAHVIPVNDAARLILDLKNVQLLIDQGAPLTVESRLEQGDRVRIRSGPMEGLEGTVCRRKNQARLIVWVNMLQQGVSLEIEDFLLEPLNYRANEENNRSLER